MNSNRPSLAQAEELQRVSPLAIEQCDDGQLGLLRLTSGTGEIADGRWYRTLVRHPDLHRAWLRFGAQLLVRGTLPGRDRELAVLRTAWHAGAEYYFGQHVQLAHEHGISPDDVTAVVEGPNDARWNPVESGLLRAVDELVLAGSVSHGTWQVLCAQYDDKQLLELPFLVGHYLMIGMVQRSIGLQPTADEPGLEAR